MTFPRFMKASFEESLNLEDDRFIQYQERDIGAKKNHPILSIIVAVFCIVILYGLATLSSLGFEGKIKESSVPVPSTNFFPLWLFWIGLVLYLMIWGVTKYFSYGEVKKYFVFLNAHNYILWLFISMNLFFLTFLMSPLTFIGVMIFFLLTCFISYAVIKSRINSLNRMLFSNVEEESRVDRGIKKILNYTIKYGWTLIALYLIWKFIFPSSTGVRTDVIGFIGLVAMWFIANIAIIICELYLFFPYLLRGYYKYKYPEEYREWEGQTPEQWYGKKYLKKLEKRRTKNGQK